MPGIVIVDTTVLLNVLDVPGFNQNRDAVLAGLEELLDTGDNLLLPMAAIFEAGNHIAQLDDGRQRRGCAKVFRDQVRAALSGSAPWTPIQLPDAREVAIWIAEFPDAAMRRIGIGDLSIIKAWERTCVQNRRKRVRIWSLDQHLAGFDSNP